MEKLKNWMIIVAVLSVYIIPLFPANAQKAPEPLTEVDKQEVDQMIENWPNTSKEVAEEMMKKYGQPHEATQSMLVWHNNGPWKRTIIYNEEIDHNFPMPHTDVLEMFVNYDVPVDKYDDLAEYDGSVIAERTKGELSARCDKEAANFLALNLAHDIIIGKRTVQNARDFYAETIANLMLGDENEYTQGLLFTPAEESGDKDEVMLTEAVEGVLGGD